MKKNIFFSILLAWLSIGQASLGDQSLRVINKSSRPALINLVAPLTKPLGTYGILVNANETKDITAPEYFWFDKVAMGGLRKKGAPSSVKIKDVLKHSFAKKMIVQLPDQQERSFDLTASNYVVIIDNGATPDTSTVQISAAENPE
jgi:hypothetical protein